MDLFHFSVMYISDNLKLKHFCQESCLYISVSGIVKKLQYHGGNNLLIKTCNEMDTFSNYVKRYASSFSKCGENRSKYLSGGKSEYSQETERECLFQGCYLQQFSIFSSNVTAKKCIFTACRRKM